MNLSFPLQSNRILPWKLSWAICQVIKSVHRYLLSQYNISCLWSELETPRETVPPTTLCHSNVNPSQTGTEIMWSRRMCNSYSPLSTLLNSTNQPVSNTPTTTQKLGINIEHIMERGAVIAFVCCVLGLCLVTLWTTSGSTWYYQSFTHISCIWKLTIAFYTSAFWQADRVINIWTNCMCKNRSMTVYYGTRSGILRRFYFNKQREWSGWFYKSCPTIIPFNSTWLKIKTNPYVENAKPVKCKQMITW